MSCVAGGQQSASPLRRRVRARWPRPRRCGPVEALCVAELSRVAGSSLFLRAALRALAGGGGESCSTGEAPWCTALARQLCIILER